MLSLHPAQCLIFVAPLTRALAPLQPYLLPQLETSPCVPSPGETMNVKSLLKRPSGWVGFKTQELLLPSMELSKQKAMAF